MFYLEYGQNVILPTKGSSGDLTKEVKAPSQSVVSKQVLMLKPELLFDPCV